VDITGYERQFECTALLVLVCGRCPEYIWCVILRRRIGGRRGELENGIYKRRNCLCEVYERLEFIEIREAPVINPRLEREFQALGIFYGAVNALRSPATPRSELGIRSL